MKFLIQSLTLLLLISLCSCDETDANENNHANKEHEEKKSSTLKQEHSTSIFDKDTTIEGTKKALLAFDKEKVEDTRTFENGMLIKWIEKGVGPKVKKGDMVLIEYRLALEDGRIVDGNHRKKLPAIPFIVGYNMQTPGWDLAFTEMHLGDFVKVEIPSLMAYGNKGLGDIIPPNTNVWLYARLYAAVAPGIEEDGIKSWKILEGEKELINGDKEVTFHTIVSTESKAAVINTYLTNFPMRYLVGQKTVVPGLRGILSKARKGDRYLVLLEANQAFGSKGYANLIKPKEKVLFNVEVVNVRSTD
jgi:FKBP-type peptidyl-prolyl cis-trans isomerase